MKILSLFDGMYCGRLAFMAAEIPVDRYVAYEIDKYAIKTTMHNFPDTEEKGDVFQADFTQYWGFDFLVGGSPCTYWSIAQLKNRETEASGIGWELFSQYVRALKEAEPRFFIYENNKSMSRAIRDSIRQTFGFEEICINSALVSAQNRNRYYLVGKRNPDGTYSKVDVRQPEDRGILLKDILDGATEPVAGRLVGRRINEQGHRDDYNENLEHLQRYEVNENPQKTNCLTSVDKDNRVCEPVRVGCMPSPDGTIKNSQGMRVYSVHGKSVNQTAQGGGLGAKTGLYAVPINTTSGGKSGAIRATCYKDGIRNLVGNSVDRKTAVAEPIGEAKTLLKAMPLIAEKYGYIPENFNAYNVAEIGDKAPTLSTGSMVTSSCAVNHFEPAQSTAVSRTDGKAHNVYQVADGQITIKGKRYPIRLPDGYYIIRKLTVRECMRLQTVPEWYDFSCVSATQAYKMLGNGWTVEVISHLIRACMANGTVPSPAEQISIFSKEE